MEVWKCGSEFSVSRKMLFVKIADCRDVGIRASKSTNRLAVLKVLNVGCKGRGMIRLSTRYLPGIYRTAPV